MDMKRILQAFDRASTKPVEGASDMSKFVRIVMEAQQVPPMPDTSGLQPGQPKDLGDGSRVEIKNDGTVHYAGAWGTYVYNAQGQHIKTISPSIGGYSQQTDPTGKVTQQNYNQGPLSIKKGADGETDAEYDLGTAKLTAKTPAGASKPTQGSIAVREMSFRDYLKKIEEGRGDFWSDEKTAGEDEPEGWFDVLAKSKDGWKVLATKRSNQAFYYAGNLANKYPDRKFAVRWPDGTINVVGAYKFEEGLKDPKDNPCWKGYKPVGTKKKGGRTVPNCVPKE